jgi:hypothetical protein
MGRISLHLVVLAAKEPKQIALSAATLQQNAF